MDIKFTLTFIASIGALIFSLLNYKRNRKFDNENYLFKSKVELYSKIQEELIKLTNSIRNNYFSAEEYLENPSKERKKLLEESANNVNQDCEDFTDFILRNSLLIPQGLFESLSEFYIKILETNYIDNEIGNNSNQMTKFKKEFNSIIDEADKISNLLRNDIHIENLNLSLYKRLK